MGYEFLENLSTKGPLKAIESALKSRKYKHGLIHHSDRGIQYCSLEYVNKLKENNVKISMTENLAQYENAITEKLNGILKYKFLIIDGFKNYI
jgi:putative transposase